MEIKTKLTPQSEAETRPEEEVEPKKTRKNNTLKADLQKEKIVEIRERNSRSKADREMRQEYAQKAYDFAKYTIAFWAFLFLVYFLTPSNQKPLSETALGIFTSACTVNILVAFRAVIKGLFYAPRE